MSDGRVGGEGRFLCSMFHSCPRTPAIRHFDMLLRRKEESGSGSSLSPSAWRPTPLFSASGAECPERGACAEENTALGWSAFLCYPQHAPPPPWC